jgi:hypothetical protein
MFRLLDYLFYCFYCLAPANGLARPGKATTFLSLLVAFFLLDIYFLTLAVFNSKSLSKLLSYFLIIIPFLLLHWRYYQPQSYEHLVTQYQIKSAYRARYAFVGIIALLATIVFAFIITTSSIR